ncbi:MAG: hypothetical protein IJT96_07050 [Lachnospiraceae bacterium]|nr:hypothetical protein [Lachnospiraceae bacterium]
MNIGKRLICFMLAFLVFSFVCDGEYSEQGRIVRSIRESDEAFPALSAFQFASKTNSDFSNEIKEVSTHTAEVKTAKKQNQRMGRYYEIIILLAIAYLFILINTGSFFLYELPAECGNSRILNYIMNQDGKK